MQNTSTPEAESGKPHVRLTIPASQLPYRAALPPFVKKAFFAAIRVLERALGTRFYASSAHTSIQAEMAAFTPQLRAAQKTGLIYDICFETQLPDEPFAHIATSLSPRGKERTGCGADVCTANSAALRALGEGVEREIFKKLNTIESVDATQKAYAGRIATSTKLLEKYAGYKREEEWSNASFRWVPAHNEVTGDDTCIPKQILVGADNSHHEPFIREATTNGLAAYYKNPIKAKLNGMLEIIERDAFIISYVNGFIPPVIPNELTLPKDVRDDCNRQRIEVFQLLLPTDFPVHVVCTVLVDKSGMGPGVMIGMSADASVTGAARSAFTEAEKARFFFRKTIPFSEGHPNQTPTNKIEARMLHCSRTDAISDIAPFISGSHLETLPPDTVGKSEKWDHVLFDNIKAHCAENAYTIITADVGAMIGDLHGWHVIFSVIPELQPLFFDDENPAIYGDRLSHVPFDTSHIQKQKGGFTIPIPFV